MKKYIFVIFIAISTCVCAQNLDISSMFKSNNQQLIEDAMRGGLYVVESSYFLQDEAGKTFGRNNQAYFNKQTYLGVALHGKLILSTAAFTPWVGDEDYARYADKYRPIVSELSYSALNDSATVQADSLALNDTTLLAQGIRVLKDSTIQGFRIDNTFGEKDGWLVLVNNNKGTYDLQSIRRKLTIDSTLTHREEMPSELGSVIGGIYVVPNYDRVGCIMFRICGVVEAVEGGKTLTIHTPFAGMEMPKCHKECKKEQLQPISEIPVEEQTVKEDDKKDDKKESGCRHKKDKDKKDKDKKKNNNNK